MATGEAVITVTRRGDVEDDRSSPRDHPSRGVYWRKLAGGLMRKRRISARILRVQGILILVVAAIHLSVTPLLRNTLRIQLSPADFQFVWPPFQLSFVVMGILLIPIGITTLFCASGVEAGELWSWRFGIINALAILSLPLVLALTMARQYFAAIPFLIAAILITLVGLSMCWPLWWVHGELTAHPSH